MTPEQQREYIKKLEYLLEVYAFFIEKDFEELKKEIKEQYN